jgi:predicted kinase
MGETNRVKRWRDTKRQHGLKALTLWLTAAEELCLKDLALQWRCSPSAVVQHALAQLDTARPQDVHSPLDTSPLRNVHEEIAALQATLPALVCQLVREELAALGVIPELVTVGNPTTSL